MVSSMKRFHCTCVCVSVSCPLLPLSLQEVFAYLVCFSQHEGWLTTSMPYQPPPGSLFLFNRQKVREGDVRNTHRWG